MIDMAEIVTERWIPIPHSDKSPHKPYCRIAAVAQGSTIVCLRLLIPLPVAEQIGMAINEYLAVESYREPDGARKLRLKHGDSLTGFRVTARGKSLMIQLPGSVLGVESPHMTTPCSHELLDGYLIVMLPSWS